MTTCGRVRAWTVLCLVTMAIAPSAGEALSVSFKDVANGVWSTGLSATGTPLAGGSVDPHFVLIGPAGCTPANVACQEDIVGNVFGPSSYVVQGPNGTYPLNGAWATANSATSQWIGPRADQTNPAVGGATFPNVAPYGSLTARTSTASHST